MTLTELTIARLKCIFKWGMHRFPLAFLSWSLLNSANAIGETGLSNTPNRVLEICTKSSYPAQSTQDAARRSQNTSNTDDLDLATQSSINRLCKFDQKAGSSETLADLTATVLEQLLEGGEVDLASTLFESSVIQRLLTQKELTPPILHLKLAEARVLSFLDRERESLAICKEIKESLAKVFGIYVLTQRFLLRSGC